MSRLPSILNIALGVIAGVVIGNPILLYLLQEKLIFFPRPINEANRKHISERFAAVREVSLVGADGQRLHGWMQKAAAEARAPLIIYFGGNEEDLSYVPSARERIPGWSLVAVNYRGYGLSEGAPGEKAIFADALAIFDALARRDDVDPRRIAVIGRSLGSGVATYLAANRPVAAVVLVTPYDSIARLAEDKFWFAPVSLILNHRFDSAALAPRVRQPALFLVAGQDEAIPPVHAQRLYERWGGPKSWLLLSRETHDTIGFHPEYWKSIARFLEATPD